MRLSKTTGSSSPKAEFSLSRGTKDGGLVALSSSSADGCLRKVAPDLSPGPEFSLRIAFGSGFGKEKDTLAVFFVSGHR